MSSLDVDRLRQLLGESIPDGGSDVDTMFSDAEVLDFLSRASGDLNYAAGLGWEVKAANYANLVNVTEGNSTRQMSDLHKHALSMVGFFGGGSSGVTDSRGHVKIGKIVRRST